MHVNIPFSTVFYKLSYRYIKNSALDLGGSLVPFGGLLVDVSDLEQEILS